MGLIPRKLEEDEIKGFVHIPKMGPLPYADEDDKEKLIALGQLYIVSVERGAYKLEPDLPPEFIPSIITSHERETLKVLTGHIFRNVRTLSGDLWRKRIKFFSSMQKNNPKIIALTIEKLDELLKVMRNSPESVSPRHK